MAQRESGANGSRTRGFMLAPPYAGGGEMQGGGGGFIGAWAVLGRRRGEVFSHKATKAQRSVRRFVTPGHRPGSGIRQFSFVIPSKTGIQFTFFAPLRLCVRTQKTSRKGAKARRKAEAFTRVVTPDLIRWPAFRCIVKAYTAGREKRFGVSFRGRCYLVISKPDFSTCAWPVGKI